MGSSESTGRSNGGDHNEEDDQNNNSIGAAAAAIGTVAVAAWGVKKLLSDNNSDEKWSQVSDQMNGGAFRALTSSSSAPPRRFKLNTDGACLPSHEDNGDGVARGPSGYAGILEDDDGNLVGGFRGFIGVSHCLKAEIHGIVKGLELFDKLGYKGSLLENDSQAAVDLVTREDDGRTAKSRVVRDCWDLIEKGRRLVRKNSVTVRWCSRNANNANKLADKLAGIAIRKRQGYVEFTDVYGEINSLD